MAPLRIAIWSPAAFAGILAVLMLVRHQPGTTHSGEFHYLLWLPMVFVFLCNILFRQQRMIEDLREEVRRLPHTGEDKSHT